MVHSVCQEMKTCEVSKTQDEAKSHNDETGTVANNESDKSGSSCANNNVLYVQEMGFNIKVQAPGVDQFLIQVSSMELVQEIHQLLMDREDTCHRTCFSLQLNGVTLDNFSELKTIEGLTEGCLIKVVEEPYTVREARIHVRHIRDLLLKSGCHDNSDAFTGHDGASLSFLNTVCGGDIVEKMMNTQKRFSSGGHKDLVDCTPSDYILPSMEPLNIFGGGTNSTVESKLAASSSILPFSPMHPTPTSHPSSQVGGNKMANIQANNGQVSAIGDGPSSKLANCLKVLTTSMWNPPPPTRRLHGDLLYLYVITIEGRRLCITASVRGFYVNKSTDDFFDPTPLLNSSPTTFSSNENMLAVSSNMASINSSAAALPSTPTTICHSLVDLLSFYSSTFRKQFLSLQRVRTSRHPFERVATPYQLYSWLGPSFGSTMSVNQHTLDSIRAEDAFSSKLGYEEHIPGQTRDWNEEMQTTRELPRKTLPERLLRERAIFKVHSDFVSAATRGAMAVVDGCVMAINPGETKTQQMFIWNNIFFSLGFDVRDHYKKLGGDAAAYVAPKNDLQGVKVYSAIDLEGLCTLGTVVVDYRGYRVTAQSIIPGILEREQEQSVVYGSIDFGKSVVSHPKYVDLLHKAAAQLKIMPHTVVNDKEEEILLCSSVECKGIIGNDGRHYILDLLRTFPPDVNFLDLTDPELIATKIPNLQQSIDTDVEVKQKPLIELSDDVKSIGFPVLHPHKLSCLRQELVDAFVESRYMMFIKCAALQLQSLELKEEEEEKKQVSKSIKNVKRVGEGHSMDEEDEGICDEEAAAAKRLLQTMVSNTDKDSTTAVCPKTKKGKSIVESKVVNEGTCGGSSRNTQSSTSASTTEIVKKAAQTVGSLKLNEFDIRFNPDIFSPGVIHAANRNTTSTASDPPTSPSTSMNKVSGECEKKLTKDVPEEYITRQMELVRDASQFVLTSQIPSLIRHFVEQGGSAASGSLLPMDGQTLADAMHSKGINIRYLGVLAKLMGKVSEIQYVYDIAVVDIVVRCVKHIFNTYLQGCDMTCTSSAVAHFLNCFITDQCGSANISSLITSGVIVANCTVSSQQKSSGGGSSKSISKRNSKKHHKQQNNHSNCNANTVDASPSTGINNTYDWIQLTSKSLWSKIVSEAKSYFNFDFNSDLVSRFESPAKNKENEEGQGQKHSQTMSKDTFFSIDDLCVALNVQKVSILRAVCIKLGIQVEMKEYELRSQAYMATTTTSNHGPSSIEKGMGSWSLGPFDHSDILNMFPTVKHINPRASDAYNFYTTGQTKIQQGFLKEGYELISEALNLLNNVYGAMHAEIAQCMRMLARLNYIMGEHGEALLCQQKALLMSERVNGFDHPYTITEYIHLALYCFANSQLSTALRLLYRARYLTLFVVGSQMHPQIALIDANIGLILHVVGEYALGQKFQLHSLELNKIFHGARSLKVAISYHLVAKTQSCMGDFRSALQNEKETFMIYKKHLGSEHEKTRESSETLKQLTQQAVLLQKKMNEICLKATAATTPTSSNNNSGGSSLPPIQIQPPSMASVLDMLNIINGILFVQISQQDIDNFKAEFEKRAALAATNESKNLTDIETNTTCSSKNTRDQNKDLSIDVD